MYSKGKFPCLPVTYYLIAINLVKLWQKGFLCFPYYFSAHFERTTPGSCRFRELMRPGPSPNIFALAQLVIDAM